MLLHLAGAGRSFSVDFSSRERRGDDFIRFGIALVLGKCFGALNLVLILGNMSG